MGSIRSRVQDNVDLLVLLAILSFFIYVSFGYPVATRRFPLLFLVLALLLVLVEILSVLLPERYSRRFEILTEGLASDIDDMAEQEGVTEGGIPDEQLAEHPSDTIRLKRIAGAIVLFLVAGYLLGVLYGIPVFVFTIYALTSRNWRHALAISVVLMLVGFFLFGDIMNVPVEEGLLWTLL